MFIISLANHKGGTGKTSLCLGLGAYFARNKFKTLIIDLDPQGHIAPGLGIEIGYDSPSIADVIEEKRQLTDIIHETSTKNLSIAPATIRLSLVAETLYNTFQREKRLKKAIAGIVENKTFDIILIDCPPSLGPLVENALTIANFCLIPCEPSSRSIDGLTDFMQKIRVVREGELDDKWCIALSRVKRSARLTNEVIEEKLSDFSERILKTRIYERESVNQAQIAGVSVYDFPRAGVVLENFDKLGKELATRLNITKSKSRTKA